MTLRPVCRGVCASATVIPISNVTRHLRDDGPYHATGLSNGASNKPVTAPT